MLPSAWCEHRRTIVLETRPHTCGIRLRERECLDCGATFMTKEVSTGDCRDLMREARTLRVRKTVEEVYAGS